MQPLYSVDHETRNNSNNAEDEREPPRTSENTPLLPRFPYTAHPRNPLTNIIVSLLMMILIAGVIIGIYLLVLQNESENILPKADTPLQLVSRSQWDPASKSQTAQNTFPYRLNRVVVVQTNTEQCYSTETCSSLLQQLEANFTAANGVMPYNFLISSNGETFEGLGWHKLSPMWAQQRPTGLVLSFIGNFTKAPPTQPQLQQAMDFFAESVSQQYLHPSFSIMGKNVNDTPLYLAQSLKGHPQWRDELSDSAIN